MASSQKILTVYQENLNPMSSLREPKAHLWKVEAKYLSVSANHQKYAELTDDNLMECVWSPLYSICGTGLATEQNTGSCLKSLYYKNTNEDLAACKVVTIDLPIPETTNNIKGGRWLSASVTGYHIFTYRIKILNSIPILIQKFLPPSLISKEQLTEILTILTTLQTLCGNCLSLEIPNARTFEMLRQ